MCCANVALGMDDDALGSASINRARTLSLYYAIFHRKTLLHSTLFVYMQRHLAGSQRFTGVHNCLDLDETAPGTRNNL